MLVSGPNSDAGAGDQGKTGRELVESLTFEFLHFIDHCPFRVILKKYMMAKSSLARETQCETSSVWDVAMPSRDLPSTRLSQHGSLS